MHRVGLKVIAVIALLMMNQSAQGAEAATVPVCNPKTNSCTTIVSTPGHRAAVTPRSPSKSVHNGTSPASPTSDDCEVRIANPLPPKSDPVWKGHEAGTVLVNPCWLLLQEGVHQFWVPTAPNQRAQPLAPSPAQLARRALAHLQIPDPVIHRSPDETATDAGVPVTWVNVWTWVWTTPASWHPLSKTAAVGGVWSTVTVTPTALVFDPGTRDDPVTCHGPGRAWTTSDANTAPTGGGCGFVYRSVSPGVKASLAIRWAVTWKGSAGSAGQLPDMTTRVNDTFAVEQIQAVTR